MKINKNQKIKKKKFPGASTLSVLAPMVSYSLPPPPQ